MSNPEFNKLLKHLSSKVPSLKTEVHIERTQAGIRSPVKVKKWKLVCTHTARRSFATNMYKAGVPSITIMAITGHKSEKEFLKYIRVIPSEHAELIVKFWNKSQLKVV